MYTPNIYCRFCAEQKACDKLKDLSTNPGLLQEINGMISFLRIKYVNFSNKRLPKTICVTCYGNLCKSNKFTKKIKVSQAVLNILFPENKNEVLSTQDCDRRFEPECQLKILTSVNTADKCVGTDLPYIINLPILTNLPILSNLPNQPNQFKQLYQLKLPTQPYHPNQLNQPNLLNQSNQPKLPNKPNKPNLPNQPNLPKQPKLPNPPYPQNVPKQPNPPNQLNLPPNLPIIILPNVTITAKPLITWSTYPYICLYCKTRCDTMVDLREHNKTFHGTCFGLLCADCESEFNSFTGFVNHVIEHRPELRPFCPLCNIKIVDPNHINTHPEPFLEASMLYNDQPLTDDLLAGFSHNLGEYSGVDIASWKDYPWMCYYCSTRFINQAILRGHLKEVHGKCFGFKCLDCDAHIKSFVKFIQHVKEHRPRLHERCEYCDFKISSIKQYIIHINEHILDHQCSACGEFFHDKTVLYTHKSAYNPFKLLKLPIKLEIPATSEDKPSDICKNVNACSTSLQNSNTSEAEKSSYDCDTCGNRFSDKDILLAHIHQNHSSLHQNIEPQVCNVCGKTFKAENRLKKHLDSHHKHKIFECSICGRQYRLKYHLKKHMAKHTNGTPYSCKYCNMSFKYFSVLRTHAVQHTGGKPFTCTICDKEFSNWAKCDKHMLKRHNTSSMNGLTRQVKVPTNPNTIEIYTNDSGLDIDIVEKEWDEERSKTHLN